MRIRAHSKALPSIPKPVGSWPQRMRRCAARLTGTAIHHPRPGIASMAMSSSAGFEPWIYEIGRPHHGHHGRTDVRRGWSARSGGIFLTTSLLLASAICTHSTEVLTARSRGLPGDLDCHQSPVSHGRHHGPH
jgi:hypothetical protein